MSNYLPSVKHVLLTPETCPCNKTSDSSCNICDGGLAVCAICGKVEIELDQQCAQARPARTQRLEIACKDALLWFAWFDGYYGTDREKAIVKQIEEALQL